MKRLLTVAVALSAAILRADTHTVAAGATDTLSNVTETSQTVKDGSGTLVVSGANSLKRVKMLEGTLKFSGGTTAISDSSATAANIDGAVFGQHGGETLVADGAKVTASGGAYVIVNSGTFTVTNAEFDATGITSHFMNGFGAGTAASSRIVIADGGVLRVGTLRPTGAPTEGKSALKDSYSVDLNAGGRLYLNDVFWIDSAASRYGRINFNGGVLYPQKSRMFVNEDSAYGWVNDWVSPTIREGGCYIETGANLYVDKSFCGIPYGGLDGGLHIRGTGVTYWRAANSSFNGGLYLESDNGAIFALNASSAATALGAVPDKPATNIWIVGSNHTLFSEGGTVEVDANRMVSIRDGRSMYVGTQGTLKIHGEIHGEVVDGQSEPTGTLLYVKNNWGGRVVLDPGAECTNTVGRLWDYGLLDVTSGVTRLSASSSGGNTEANPLLLVQGNNSSYAVNKGHLEVCGGSLETSQSGKLLIAKNYAQVEVTNGGSIVAPSSTYVNGLRTPVMMTIADGGTVVVGTFQVANSTTSTLNLNGGGTLKTGELWSSDGATGIINFDGGCVSSLNNELHFGLGGSEARWRNAQVYVKEGGAVFKAPTKHLWLRLPLKNGTEEGVVDGGIECYTGIRDAIIIMATNNFTTGRTLLAGAGTVQMRVDDAVLPGNTLVLSNGSYVAFCKYDVYEDGLFTNSTRTEQWIGRLEGDGILTYNRMLHVTNAIAPSVLGSGANGCGRLVFHERPSDLRGDYEIRGDAGHCGYIAVAPTANVVLDISGLKLKMVEPESLNSRARSTFYRILDAPAGYTGKFDASALSGGWAVKYSSDGKGAYIYHPNGTILSFK